MDTTNARTASLRRLRLGGLLPALALGLALLPTVGCSSGGGSSPDPVLVQQAETSAAALRDLKVIVEGYLALMEAIEDPNGPPAGVTFNPTTREFTLQLDANGDRTDDAELTGRITAERGLGDGLDPTDRFTAQWAVTGAIQGAGELRFYLNTGGKTLNLNGEFALSTRTGSRFVAKEIGVDLRIDLPTLDVDAGLIPFELGEADDPDRLVGSISLSFDEDAWVFATWRNEDVEYYIDLDTFEAYYED